MNCLEWLPIYFGILKAGCLAVPLNFRYSSDEIAYCLDLADVEALVFGPEFIDRLEPILSQLDRVRLWFYVGNKVPDFAESYRELVMYCSFENPPVHLELSDLAAIYFSSGTTGFPKAILHNHKALLSACLTEQRHHGQTHAYIYLHPAPVPHRGQDALVRLPGHRRQGGAAAGGVPPVDPAGGDGGEVYHRLAAGALGPGHSGRHRQRHAGAGRLPAGPVAADAHWRPAGTPQPDPAVEKKSSPTTCTTPITACPSPLDRAVSTWVWKTSARWEPSASRATCGRPRWWTSRATRCPRVRWESWRSAAPA